MSTRTKPDGGELRWGVLVMLMALCFISHTNRISMAVAGDERIMKQYGLAPEQMGLVYSAFLLVYTLFMIPGGFLIDRAGARRALLMVGFGSALLGAMTGVAGWVAASTLQLWTLLVVVRGVMGFFTTPLHPGSARGVGLWMPLEWRSLANGMVTGAALLGIACSYKVFGSLIAWFDWPGAFCLTGGVTLAWGVVWMLTTRQLEGTKEKPASDTVGPRAPAELWWTRLKDRSLILLTLSYAAIGYFQYVFFYWMHYYFGEVLKLGTEQSRYYAGIPPLAMAVGMPLGGWVSDRWQRRLGRRRGRALVPMASMTAGAVFLGLGVVSKEPFWIVCWLSLSLGVVGACEGAFWSTAVELGGVKGGTTAAIVNTGGNGGGLLAPVLTPVISGWLGWSWGISLGGVICLLGALCWFGIVPPAKSDE